MAILTGANFLSIGLTLPYLFVTEIIASTYTVILVPDTFLLHTFLNYTHVSKLIEKSDAFTFPLSFSSLLTILDNFSCKDIKSIVRVLVYTRSHGQMGTVNPTFNIGLSELKQPVSRYRKQWNECSATI